MVRRAVTLAVVVALTGCAPKAFIHPSGSANVGADTAQCEYEIEMVGRPGSVYIPWYYNNSQALGAALGAAIGGAIRYDRLRTLCMQAKGYNVVPLSGAPTPIGQPQPNLIGVVPPAPTTQQPAPDQPMWATAAGQTAPAIQPVNAPVSAPAAPSAAPTIAGIKGESRYLIQAEGVAKVSDCAQATVVMTSKGAGSEMFAAACSSGITLAIRCEVDGCRVLR
jgi:hypothetical protein